MNKCKWCGNKTEAIYCSKPCKQESEQLYTERRRKRLDREKRERDVWVNKFKRSLRG